MKIDAICVGPMQVNCYIVSDDGKDETIIIDPGDDYPRIKRFLEGKKLKPAFVINTHGHIDHIGADDRFGVDVYIHRDDICLLKDARLNLSAFFSSPFTVNSQVKVLEDNQNIYLGKKAIFKVIHTPGHTAGSVCFELIGSKSKALFSGDTLFCEGVGRTDFPGASSESLVKSIKERLFVLDDNTVIYPGHGGISSIGHEKRNNPFIT